MDPTVVVVGLEGAGLVVASCLAGPQRRVVAVEPDPARRSALRRGRLPYFEPGLDALFREAVGCGWLEVVDEPEPGQPWVVCVGTHPTALAGFDRLVEQLPARSVVALQAPVPVGTAEQVRARLRERKGAEFPAAVVSNPLLLRRGQAVPDLSRPRWVLVGGEEPWAVEAVANLFRGRGAVLVRTDLRTAEAAGWVAEALPGALGSLVEAVRALAESWQVDFDTLRRTVLSEVVEGAVRRSLHTVSRGVAAGTVRASALWVPVHVEPHGLVDWRGPQPVNAGTP